MRGLVAVAAMLAFTPVNAAESTPLPKSGRLDLAAVMCFKSGEQRAGTNKICYYDCLGNTVAITIGALDFCPLSINN